MFHWILAFIVSSACLFSFWAKIFVKMGRKCTVMNCKTGYDSQKNQPHIMVYGFPSDPDECRKWVAMIPNKVTPSKYVGVCALHWPEDTPTVLRGRYRIPAMPPSINLGVTNVSNIPTAYSVTPRPTKKTTSASRREPEADPLDLFREQNSFKPRTLRKNLQKLLRLYGTAGCNADKTEQILASTERCGPVHAFVVYFVITENEREEIVIEFEGYKGLKCFRHPNFRKQSVTSWDQLDAVLHFYTGMRPTCTTSTVITTNDNQLQAETKTFVERQIQLGNKPRNSEVYTIKDLTLAFSWYVRSRSLYIQLRKHMILPSLTTLRRITRIAKNTADETLYTKMFKNMEERDKACILIVDEVYVKSGITYSGGQVFGLSKDNPKEPAKTLLCVMMKCCHSRKKIIAKMIPCHKLNAQFMHDCVVDVIQLLHRCGARVVALINDNNKVNQKFFTLFRVFNSRCPWIASNPAVPLDPIFLLYDPIHIVKNIRNNFILEKTKTLIFLDPDTNEKIVAKWSDIEDLHRHEEENISLLYLSKLTRSSVYPTNLERQKVQLALNVFCDQTVAALTTSSASTDSMKSTAKALMLVIRFFKLLNVKSTFTEARLNDPDRPAVDYSDSGMQGFKTLSDWVKIAEFMSPTASVRQKQLTRDTSSAIKWTCESLQCLATYLLNTDEPFKFDKVCLGIFTQDDIERHFGYFRMSSGSCYHITVQDIFATHNIDRARLLLQNSEELDDELSTHMCADCNNPTSAAEAEVINDMVTSGVEGRLSSDEQMSVYMVAGYVAFKHPELRGTHLPSDMTAYFDHINRGKLSTPSDSLLHLVLLAMIFFIKTEAGNCRKRLCNIFATFPELFSIDIVLPGKSLQRLANTILKRHVIKSASTQIDKKIVKRKAAKLCSTTTAVQRN